MPCYSNHLIHGFLLWLGSYDFPYISSFFALPMQDPEFQNKCLIYKADLLACTVVQPGVVEEGPRFCTLRQEQQQQARIGNCLPIMLAHSEELIKQWEVTMVSQKMRNVHPLKYWLGSHDWFLEMDIIIECCETLNKSLCCLSLIV